ncbi:Uclacyanin 1, partial [Linum grandiflorum]
SLTPTCHPSNGLTSSHVSHFTSPPSINGNLLHYTLLIQTRENRSIHIPTGRDHLLPENTPMATAIFIAFAALLLLQTSVQAQTTHTVAGSTGWTIPQGGPSVYSTWAASNSFSVGDVLVFNFPAGAHDVTEVTKADYDACTSTNPLTLVTTSPARVTLNSAGDHYYICNFPGHCAAGQKLTVNVLGSATAPSPAPSSMTPRPRSPSPVVSAPPPAMSAPPPAMSAPSPAMSAPPPAMDAPATTPSMSPVPGDVSPSSAPGPASRPPMTYTVGDSFGWNIPTSGGAGMFRNWAAGKDFMVGDTLVFNYTARAHNVAEVTRDAFTACRTTNPISIDSTPPSRKILTSPGEHFYICAFPQHCTLGQVLSINVTGAAATTPTGSPSGSPSGSMTPSSPSPSGDSAPPPPDSAASFTGVSVATILSVLVVLLF